MEHTAENCPQQEQFESYKDAQQLTSQLIAITTFFISFFIVVKLIWRGFKWYIVLLCIMNFLANLFFLLMQNNLDVSYKEYSYTINFTCKGGGQESIQIFADTSGFYHTLATLLQRISQLQFSFFLLGTAISLFLFGKGLEVIEVNDSDEQELRETLVVRQLADEISEDKKKQVDIAWILMLVFNIICSIILVAQSGMAYFGLRTYYYIYIFENSLELAIVVAVYILLCKFTKMTGKKMDDTWNGQMLFLVITGFLVDSSTLISDKIIKNLSELSESDETLPFPTKGMKMYFSLNIFNSVMNLTYSVLFLLIAFKIGDTEKSKRPIIQLEEQIQNKKKEEDDDYVRRRLINVTDPFEDGDSEDLEIP